MDGLIRLERRITVTRFVRVGNSFCHSEIRFTLVTIYNVTERKSQMSHEKIAMFDLDGTVVNTDAANFAAYRIALAKVGIKNIAGIYGRMTAEVIRSTIESVSIAEMNYIVQLKVEAYCKGLWRTRLGPAASDFKCILVNRDRFDKIVLLTNSLERRAIETLRHFGLQNYFDEIVCNGGSGDKYANYFKSFDSDAAACVVWENEEGQIMSAIAAGVKTENIRKVG